MIVVIIAHCDSSGDVRVLSSRRSLPSFSLGGDDSSTYIEFAEGKMYINPMRESGEKKEKVLLCNIIRLFVVFLGGVFQ